MEQNESETLWHTKKKEDVIAHLETNDQAGLNDQDVIQRQKNYGRNILPEPKRPGLLALFFHQFQSPLIYLLIFASFIAIYVGEKKDAVVIWAVILLNAIIGMLQEGRAERSLKSLRKLSRLSTMVIRNNKKIKIEASELVPGDIIELNAGDAVPADARLINTHIVHTSESALTGESLPVPKSPESIHTEAPLAERANMLYAGTHLTTGKALAVVVHTGRETEIGKVNELAQSTKEEKTLLEIKLMQFSRSLTSIAIGILFLIIGIGLLRHIPLAQISLIAIGQMVSIVPEGLPVALTIALAVGVQRMAKRGTLIRKLPAVEILGSTTVICTDKTGTLTKNELVATSIYLPELKKSVAISGSGYNPEGKFSEALPQSLEIQKFFKALVLCNDAQLLPPDESHKDWHLTGDPTEGALLSLAKKAGINMEEIKKEYPRLDELPFDSKTKFMATLHQKNQSSNWLILKGAPEGLFPLLKDPVDKNIKAAVLEMSSLALRVLAVAEVDDSALKKPLHLDSFTGKARLLGLVGEQDTPRPEAAHAISEARNAGIKIVMITGDHKATGLAIAKSLGIANEEHDVMDGSVLEKLSEEEIQKEIKNISVFTRMQPVHKYKIVDALEKLGEVVAMTGDGVNDAPALMKANVGVAMGLSGTEAAKEAAKIVITDDHFKTIIDAVSEGRLVYQNVKKLLLFLFVSSMDELFILLLALILGFPPPLAAVQILWLNLVTEGVLTINLIMEPHEGGEMQRPPIPRSEPLLDKELVKRMPLLIFTSVAVTLAWFIYRTKLNLPHKTIQTEIFTLMVFCQWFNVLNCKSKTKSILSESFFKNPWLIGGLIAGILLEACVLYVPFLNELFHTVPLDIKELTQLMIISSTVLWTEELRKYFVRKGA